VKGERVRGKGKDAPLDEVFPFSPFPLPLFRSGGGVDAVDASFDRRPHALAEGEEFGELRSRLRRSK
jgi:hypothetical protein